MKKKIAILGSTGSIGKNLIKILSKDKNNINIFYLRLTKIINYYLNSKTFDAKNIIITDKKKYEICLKKIKIKN